MTRRRLGAFVEALLGNRRPRPFAAEPEDVDAMRAAIELRGAQPGAGLPRSEFVAELHHRLAEELGDSTTAEVDAGGRRFSRRWPGCLSHSFHHNREVAAADSALILVGNSSVSSVVDSFPPLISPQRTQRRTL